MSMLLLMNGHNGAAPPSYTYATWNELDKSASFTLSNADLTVTHSTNNGSWHLLRSTIGKSTGQWQAELYNPTASGDWIFGICKAATSVDTFLGADTNGLGYHQNGSKVNAGGLTAYGAAIGGAQYVTVRYNADNGDLEFKLDGVSQGVIATGLTGEVFLSWSSFTAGKEGTLNTGAVQFNHPFAGINQGWFTS